MDNHLETTGVETQETALSEVQSQENVESNIPTTNIEIEKRSIDDIASDLLSLKSQPFNLLTKTWTPEVIGEKKMMLFVGGGYSWVPSMNEPHTPICLPYVEFIEAFLDKDGSRQLCKWRMTTSRITNFFLQLTGSKEEGFTDLKYKYKPQTAWEIEYIGQVPSKKNPVHKIMDFAVRLPIF